MITAPVGSVMDTMVLLNVLLMCAWPWATFFFSLRRTFLTRRRVPSALVIALLIGDRALLLTGLLLAGDGLLRALAGTRVGLGALTAHGQAAAVPDALVAADLDLAADVGGDLAAQVTLDLEVGLDVVAEPDELVVGEVLARACPG